MYEARKDNYTHEEDKISSLDEMAVKSFCKNQTVRVTIREVGARVDLPISMSDCQTHAWNSEKSHFQHLDLVFVGMLKKSHFLTSRFRLRPLLENKLVFFAKFTLQRQVRNWVCVWLL